MERMRNDYTDGWYEYIRLKQGRPMNETEEHFFCKCVGMVWLFHNKNCRFISTEIDKCWHLDDNIPGYSNNKYWGKNNRDKSIIDVIGMTRKFDYVCGIEAKASLADYRNGFCACMPYTYVICPKDVIPIDEIPDGIGLIYVDIPNFHIIGWDDVRGVKVVKNCNERIDARWLDKDGNFDEDKWFTQVDKWYDDMCYRNTLKNVFNRNNIPIYKKKSIRKSTDDTDDII